VADLPSDSHSYLSGRVRRILLATDFTPNSDRAAGYALSLAQEHQAHLSLLHVVQEELGHSEQNKSRLLEFMHRRLREVVPAEAELWCEPEFFVEFGVPADAILKAAAGTGKDDSADLVVLAVRKAGTFPGHLPPATAYKVVCQAPCPVLTVRG
jgi:nucleotide-binding universal stress UspA family protein